MTLIKDLTDCSTYSVRGLDNQLISQMNKIRPGLLVQINDLNVNLGKAVHPWMQAAAKECLKQAIADRGQQMTINSAYRTLAGQMLLRSHFEHGKRCGIVAASQPGQSNHNNASAIDIEDSHGWQAALEANGWKKLGSWDDMHFDCVHQDIAAIQSIAVLAFQQLWNIARPTEKLAHDGDFGPATASRLSFAPAEGFPGVGVPRILKLTAPLQIGDDVGELQLALRNAGITVDKADKVFGPGTDKAVKEFQAAKSLIVDGIVGNATFQALRLPIA
jgi:hypothetical protein